MINTLAQHQEHPGLWIVLMFSVAAVVSVGEEARPVDLPVVHDAGAGVEDVAVDEDALGGVLVPAEPEVGHVQLHREELIRAHVVKAPVHLILVVA